MPEFYIIIARKIFSRFFPGGAPDLPSPYAYGVVGIIDVVGTQSTGGEDIFASKYMYENVTKSRNFT